MRTVRTYQNDYTIACDDDNTNLYYCLQAGVAMLKKDRKPAAYKNLTLAEKFIISAGAQEVKPEPKKPLWTPPQPANIAPIEEQLAALPADALRFVVVEAGYGFYKEQGYAVYDRVKQEIVCPKHTGSHNYVFQQRSFAEEDAAAFNVETPKEVEIDMDILGALVEIEDAYAAGQPIQSEPVEQSDEDRLIVDSHKHVAGEIINARDGIFVAIEDSEYLSPADVADMDDQDIFGVVAGWQTKVRRA